MKQLYIKSYTSAGVFITTLTGFSVGSFTKEMNGGLGGLTFSLPRKLDSFNSDSALSLGNLLELWVTDEDTGSTPVKVYTGYIEQQVPYINGGEELTQILCLGVVSKLASDILKDGVQTTLYTAATDGLTTTSASLAAAEVADVLRAIVALFGDNNSGVVLNSSTDGGDDTLEDTGNDMTYTFQATTYAEAIKKCQEAAPANWFWYVDQNGVFHFRAISSTADHTFQIAKQISRIEVNKGLDSVKNFILIWDGASTYKHYQDDTSVALYGRRIKQITDSNIGDSATMDNIGAAVLAENKDPRLRITLEIIDNNEDPNGYDIESIEPGDTCAITGLLDNGLLTSNMVIKEVSWAHDRATVVIETRQDFDLDKFLINLKREQQQQSLDGIPETYS